MLRFLARGFFLALPLLAWVATACAAPTAPSGLTASNFKATSFTLTWAAATGGTGGIAGYSIYQDGISIGSTTAARTFAVSSLAPNSVYNITVTARDGAGVVSVQSAPLVVTTPPDTTVPTKPADLVAVNVTTSSCTLTWTGSTDNVGVIGYNIYRSGVLLGSSPTTAFDVGGLAPDTTNNLTVRATDAAGNLSAASIALAVRTFALPPSAPTGLAVTALKATSFTLTWTASSGGTGGIAGYEVYQNGMLIGFTTTARTFAVSGLTPTTAYSMTVSSRDTAGNLSPTSGTLEVTTSPDTTVPTRPANLVAANITTTSFTLTWSGSTDNVGVAGYNIYRGGVLLGSSAVTTYGITGLIPDSTNNITVRAVDAAGNLSAASIALSVRMIALPTSIPAGLAVTALRPSSFTLQWSASTGGTGGIKGYEVYLNEALIGSPTTRSLAVSGLVPQTTYSMTVASYDSVGNVSTTSEPLVVSTPADTTKPTVPKGLSADNVTPTSFSLTWTASTDNVGVAGYDVYRNNLLIGSTPNPVFAVTGLTPATLSSMRVKAKDAAGNISGFSVILPVTTSAQPNVPPTIILNSPSDGSSFTLPFTLAVSASAADSDGTVTKVEFFDNGIYLGETTDAVSGQPGIWLLTLSSELVAGSHALSARATDNENATADSIPVAITINNPNLSPTITITAPATGTCLVAPGFITVTVDATDSDGTITKVEFYEGGNFLGAVVTPTTPPSTYTFPLTLYSTGTYTITTVATDNSTAQSISAPVMINVNSGAAELPFVSNFEASEGFHLGSLSGQLSWFATGGVTIVPSIAPGSPQELSIPAAQPVEIFSHDFSAAGVSPVFVDFQALPVAGTNPATAVMFSTPAAQVALVGATSPAGLWIFGGGGTGWYASGQTIATDANGRTVDWIRLTTREDYSTKKWDLYLNSQMVAADVAFADASATALTDFSVNGHANAASAFDSFYASPENPLFADANHNGLDDAWETAHGLSLATNNRNLSPSGNGVTVIQSYVAGTDPSDYFNGTIPTLTILSGNNQVAPKNQFNPLPFDIGVWNAARTTPLVNAPVSFTVLSGGGKLALTNTGSPTLLDSVNLTTDADGTAQVYYLQPPASSVQSVVTLTAGTAQTTFSTASASNGDSDNNGFADSWENQYFGQLGVAPDADADGDGLTNLQEFQRGTNPISSDTDGDGISDGTEVSLGMNPLVADSENLPGKITGLRLFLSADTGINGSGSIMTWFDQSGRGNDATQPNGGQRPTVVPDALNGRPVMHFDGAQTQFFTLPAFMTGATEGEVFAIVKAANRFPSSSRSLWRFGGNNNATFYPSNSGEVRDDFGSTTVQNLGVPPGEQDVGTFQLYNISAQANSWISRFNGQQYLQSTTNTVAFADFPLLGARHEWYGFDGDIAEVLVYDRVLTAQERETVGQYLEGKYQLPGVTVPTSPVNLQAVAISCTQVSVTWQPGASSSRGVAYLLERKAGDEAYTKLTDGSSALSYLDNGLAANTAYTYRISAHSYAGSSSDNALTTVTTLSLVDTSNLPLNGIRLWLSADAAGITTTENGLDYWQDQSGLGNNASQSVASLQPQFVTNVINGRPVVRFDGTGRRLNLPHFMSGGTAAELFVIMKGSTSAGSCLFSSMGYSEITQYPSSPGQISDGFGSTRAYVFSTARVDLTQPRLYHVSAAPNSWSASLDGNVLFMATANTVNFNDGAPYLTPLIGAARGGNYYSPSNLFTGDVAEIIIYDRTLTPGERESVNRYLNQKYNFSSRPFTDQTDFANDSDGDGLTNSQEAAIGTNSYLPDTDGDGVPDAWEISHGLNPLISDSQLNPDGDELSNLEEYLHGTDPQITSASDPVSSVNLIIYQPSTR